MNATSREDQRTAAIRPPIDAHHTAAGELSSAQRRSARFTAAVKSLDAPTWNAIVRLFEDASFHQTWAYGAQKWHPEQLRHVLLYQDDEIVAAAQVVVVKVPMLNRGIAHCKFGPMWKRRDAEMRPEVYRQMLLAMRNEFCLRQRLVCRIKPWEASSDVPSTQGFLKEAGLQPQMQLPLYRTFVIDMSRSLDELRSGFHSKWRYNLKKAEKQSIEVRNDSTDDAVRIFMGLYADMRSIKTFYDTSDIDILPQIVSGLADDLRPQVFIASVDNKAVAAVVISMIGDTAFYLFGATGDSGRNSGASYLLFWRVMAWLKENDCRWLDLVGSRPRGAGSVDGYRQFKAGMIGKTNQNGAEHEIADWDMDGDWASSLIVHGVSNLRRSVRQVGHKFSKIRERLASSER